MHFDDPQTWITSGLGLWQLVLTVTIWLRRPGEEAGAAVKQLADALNAKHQEIELQLVTLKGRVDNTPTNKELADLTGLVRVIESQNKAQNDALAALSRQLGLLSQHLLNQQRD
jgi:hypothetical protein